MKIKDKKLKKLINLYKEISTLEKISSLLSWDLNVNMPPKGGEARARQISYIAQLVTEKWLDTEFRKLFDLLVARKNKLEGLDRAIFRSLEREAKFYFRVPKKIIKEKAETSTYAFLAWKEARREENFLKFLPFLKRLVEIERMIAEYLTYEENPYDALLDLYEPELTTKKLKEIFDNLVPELTLILKKIRKRKDENVQGLVNAKFRYPESTQKKLALFVLKKMGFSFEAGRMDVSPHPFTTSFSRFDVRITNRYKEEDFRESLMAAMHEGGHALYDQGISEDFEDTPLDGGASLGIHESQSRFWENQIGRSLGFLEFITPILHAFYPDQLSSAGVQEIYSLFNEVKPGLIRTEADEVSYNLHIALRFEIEEGLINSKMKVEDLPDIWREKMKVYLDKVPEKESEGVLQDVHWSYGSFGYFPTYTLGNLYAAQIKARMDEELETNELVQKGGFKPILNWLRDKIHKFGKLYSPAELMKKLRYEGLDSSYFLDYIKRKYL